MTLDLSSSVTPKGWKDSTGLPDPELHAQSFETKKKIIKKNQIFKKLVRPGKLLVWQLAAPYFLSDFWTLQNNSGKPKSVDSKQKNYLQLWKISFLDYLKRKTFHTRSKKVLISLITGEPVYIYSTMSIALFW